MKPTNFIHAARAKKQAEVIRSLEQAFSDFPYPVYLFGSFANGNFHGYSDIDLVILVSKQQARQAYNLACDKLAGLRAPYDILTCQSVDELDNTIKSALHPIHAPEQAETPLKRQQGMTLIELLIAMLLGAFLLGGVIQIFVNTKQTYRMQESLSRLQENGRFAMEFLTYDIRMAGFLGCMSRVTSVTNTLNNATNYLFNFGIPIQGNNWDTATSTWLPAADGSITSPLNGSDIITIRSVNPNGTMVTSHSGINNCDIAIVSDCQAAAVFQITNFNAANNNNKDYKGGELFLAQTTSYYIRSNPGGIPALYRRRIRTDAEELVEGIEQMQILYGIDTDGDSTADRYLTADNVADWNNVSSVRISLLARTIDNNIASQVLDYTYNGATVTPTDRRIRRVFTSTIALRNRLP
ncbi:PilW family protein [Methylomonas sp. SURF-2]|uniref:PilW family protein n=1 Tax=Methylomonas subterranea TaxID=2952225 RepID=A0ABT1TID6_9GAMM|nr:PilW family protein [Methylomonas sp. SURF-2]MCQ8105218.1 PilW family protein [Methylomonas sp. SURF-2]